MRRNLPAIPSFQRALLSLPRRSRPFPQLLVAFRVPAAAAVAYVRACGRTVVGNPAGVVEAFPSVVRRPQAGQAAGFFTCRRPFWQASRGPTGWLGTAAKVLPPHVLMDIVHMDGDTVPLSRTKAPTAPVQM